VVTKANAPKWREVYVQNTIALRQLEAQSQSAGQLIHDGFAKSVAQINAVIDEAKAVLLGLGEEIVV